MNKSIFIWIVVVSLFLLIMGIFSYTLVTHTQSKRYSETPKKSSDTTSWDLGEVTYRDTASNGVVFSLIGQVYSSGNNYVNVSDLRGKRFHFSYTIDTAFYTRSPLPNNKIRQVRSPFPYPFVDGELYLFEWKEIDQKADDIGISLWNVARESK